MDYFTYNFNEDAWNVFLIEDDDNVIADEDAAAETKFDERELYFRRSSVTLKIVLHELWHVYFGYCYLGDTQNIGLDDFEEISAALFADKVQRILDTAVEIELKLNELKEKQDASEN